MHKKRFIADAQCPQCSAKDSLRVWRENGIECVECVECGYEERQLPEVIKKNGHSEQEVIGIFKPE